MATVPGGSKEERFGLIARYGTELGVSYLCEWLGVSRAGYYSWRNRPLSPRAIENRSLLDQITRIHEDSDTSYGSPRVYKQLLREGVEISCGRVERLMSKAGLVGKAARIYRRHALTKAFYNSLPNLRLERGMPEGINEQWVGDVTYLKLAGQWRYLAVVMDLYSRRIIGWQLSKYRTAEVTREALRQAISTRHISPGLIFHTDRGAEYGAWLIQDELKNHGILPSMNRAESVVDNAHMESFFRSMKTEVIHGVEFSSEHELRMVIARYVDCFYNEQRLHSGLGYIPPTECERMAA